MIRRFLRKSDQSLATVAAFTTASGKTAMKHVPKNIRVDTHRSGIVSEQVNVIKTNIARKPYRLTVFSKFINAISCIATSNTYARLSGKHGKTQKN